MSEIRTILYDPQSFNSSRCVFTIPRGLVINAQKIRICDFKISNKSGNGIYFNHAGVYSLLSKVSILSLQGTEIDYLSNMEMMSIKLLQMENASQFSVNRQLSQSMCNSVFVNNLGQASLTELKGEDDATAMSIYWDISLMLSYLQRRVVIDEGMTILLEFASPDVLGFNYEFSSPPSLAVDEFLTSIPKDNLQVLSYTTIIQDKLILPTGSTGFEKRLNSFYNQFLGRIYFMNILNKSENPFINAIDKTGQSLNILIDGKQIIPLKGIDNPAKKLGFINDFTSPFTIPAYSSALNLLSSDKSFTNVNNGLDYRNTFSYGCVSLNRFVGNDITFDYSFTQPIASPSGETLLVMAEVLRQYDSVADRVSFVSSQVVPS